MSYLRCPACGNYLNPSDSTCSCCGTPIIKKESISNPVKQSDNKESGVEIYNDNISAVVKISAATSLSEGFCGTGFIVSNDGLVVTNTHVVSHNRKPCKFLSATINNTTVKCTLQKMGDDNDGNGSGVDCALLKLDHMPADAKVLKLGNSDLVNVGERVYYIGNSLGEGLCITSGIVSDKNRMRPEKKHPFIMTDAATNPGNSGGPLFNEKGEVIGLHVSARSGAVGMKFAIPINVVIDCLNL